MVFGQQEKRHIWEFCVSPKINFGDENPKTIDVKESLNNAKEQLSDGPKKSLSIKNEFGGLVELRLVKWAYFLDLAHKLGWEPEGTKPSNEWRTPGSWDMFDYYGGAGQIISVTDASMLGEALSRAYRIGWPENENANFDVFEFEEERNFLGMLSRFCLDGGSLHLF